MKTSLMCYISDHLPKGQENQVDQREINITLGSPQVARD